MAKFKFKSKTSDGRIVDDCIDNPVIIPSGRGSSATFGVWLEQRVRSDQLLKRDDTSTLRRIRAKSAQHMAVLACEFFNETIREGEARREVILE